jgi:hypothetical protein
MKTNKTNIFIIAIILSAVFFNGCSCERITEVRILYTPIATYSAVPVHCDLFEYAFDKIMKDHVVSDKDLLKKINSEIQTLTVIKDTLIIDVRIKCFVNYTNRIDTLCITNNDLILVNGLLMNRNENIVTLIRDEIY